MFERTKQGRRVVVGDGSWGWLRKGGKRQSAHKIIFEPRARKERLSHFRIERSRF